jgi:hypothetical protein
VIDRARRPNASISATGTIAVRCREAVRAIDRAVAARAADVSVEHTMQWSRATRAKRCMNN